MRALVASRPVAERPAQRSLAVLSLGAGWSGRRSLRAVRLAVVLRVAVVLFAFHASGAAHLLADVLLEEDMTCVDELARKPHDGLAPSCPATQSMAHGQAFVPPDATALAIHSPAAEQELLPRTSCASMPLLPPSSIDRPPRS
jgi:hypothetical protein